MTASQAAELRRRWTQQASPACEHRDLRLEYTENGYLTGNYNCVTCGTAVVQVPK